MRFLLFSLLLAVSFLSTSASKKVDCNQHKIYCHIKLLRPDMAKNNAMELSNLIYKYSRKYGTDPHITVAIGMQESGLNSVHRKTTGLIYREKCHNFVEESGSQSDRVDKLCIPSLIEETIYTDFGMFQFHHRTIEAYQVDLHRVFTHDLEYIVEAHIKILKKKVGYCKHHKKDAWTCYHSVNKSKRLLYKSLVERYLLN